MFVIWKFEFIIYIFIYIPFFLEKYIQQEFFLHSEKITNA